jgi:hypothetical protein
VALQDTLAQLFTDFMRVSKLDDVEKELLSTAWLCLLQEKSKNKPRPIQLKSLFSKLIWTHLISTNKDQRPYVPGSSFRKKGGCAAIAQALQKCLDDGRIVCALDSENAFNTCSRERMTEYILSRGPLYYEMYPFFNLFYCSPTTARAFSFAGVLCFCIIVTNGSAQGCTSGPWAFHICTLHVYDFRVLGVVDDLYLVDATADTISELVTLLSHCGLKINVGKSTILAPPSSAIASSCGFPVSSAPKKALGTYLLPRMPSANEMSVVLQGLLSKQEKRLLSLSQIQTSAQIKFMTARCLQFFCLYMIQACPSVLLDSLCLQLEDFFMSAVASIINIPREVVKSRSASFHNPLEVGGLGFIPFTDVCHSLRSSLQAAVGSALGHLGIAYEYSLTPPLSLSWIWRHVASSRAASVGSFGLELSSFSWISTWPSIALRRLSDRELIFAVCLTLDVMPHPVNTVCAFSRKNRHSGVVTTVIFDYRSASQYDRLQHWLNCNRCGAAAFQNRHECVLQELVHTCDFHNVLATKYPPNMPVPGKSKGGPDFHILSTSNTLEGSTLVGDVAVTSKQRMGSVFSAKIRQYKDFSPAVCGTTLPFVMNTKGAVDKRTISILRSKHIGGHIIHDIVINSQFALLKSLCASYYHLNVRPLDDPDLLAHDQLRSSDDDNDSDCD